MSDSHESTEAAPPRRPAMPMIKRFKIAAVVVVVTMVPAWIMLAVTFAGTGELQAAAFWASLPAVAGIAATISGGQRFAIIAAIVTGLLAPVSIVAGISPVAGAALMALMAMTVGRLARVGLHKSGLLYPVMIAWTLIDPPTWAGQSTVDRTDSPYLLWMGVIFFVGAVFPALVMPRLLRGRQLPAPTPHSQSEAVPYTVIITVLVTIATFVVLDNSRLYGGAFLIAAILVLAPIGTAQTLRPTVLRVLGTLIGSVILIGLVSLIQSLAIIYLFGLIFIIVALMARFGVHGWIYYVFMMPATASLNATTLVQVGQLGEQRLIDNAIGGALVLIASAAAIAYSSWVVRHGHSDDTDPESMSLMRALSQPASGGSPAPGAAH